MSDLTVTQKLRVAMDWVRELTGERDEALAMLSSAELMRDAMAERAKKAEADNREYQKRTPLLQEVPGQLDDAWICDGMAHTRGNPPILTALGLLQASGNALLLRPAVRKWLAEWAEQADAELEDYRDMNARQRDSIAGYQERLSTAEAALALAEAKGRELRRVLSLAVLRIRSGCGIQDTTAYWGEMGRVLGEEGAEFSVASALLDEWEAEFAAQQTETPSAETEPEPKPEAPVTRAEFDRLWKTVIDGGNRRTELWKRVCILEEHSTVTRAEVKGLIAAAEVAHDAVVEAIAREVVAGALLDLGALGTPLEPMLHGGCDIIAKRLRGQAEGVSGGE